MSVNNYELYVNPKTGISTNPTDEQRSNEPGQIVYATGLEVLTSPPY